MIETLRDHLKRLPAEHLRDLARNSAAPLETRKLAYDLLVEAKHPYAKTSELYHLTANDTSAEEDLEKVLDEVATQLTEPAPAGGAPAASVTTATLFGPPEDLVTGVKTEDGWLAKHFKAKPSQE